MSYQRTACGAAFLASMVVGYALAEPARYTAVDITGWSPTQLDTLPFFKRWIPASPSGLGVPAQFEPVVRAASGYWAGTVPQGIPYAGNEAVLLIPKGFDDYTPEMVDPFGTYSWGYWIFDGKDSHYNFGYVRSSVPRDVNFMGVMVGAATIASAGDYSSGAIFHAFRYDKVGGRIDLFPNDGDSTVACINNRNEMAGYRSDYGAFRRAPDGATTTLDPVAGYTGIPRWINASGIIIGSRYPSRSFVAPANSETQDLESLNDFPVVAAADLNDTNWIVGKCGNFGEQETYAVLWEPLADGTWRVWDLVEQLDTPDVLLESAVAIDNAGNIIARGHEDGTDLFGSRLYWLTADAPPDGWCTPDIGIHPADATPRGGTAEFSITVVNEAQVSGYAWRADGDAIDPLVNPSAATRTLIVSGSAASNAGTVYDCVVTSACGQSFSEPSLLLDAEPDCPADLAAPFGVLDLADIGAFTQGFTGQDPIADLAAPFGVFDLADIGAFVQAFTTQCAQP